jgi:hypothetical protein
MKTRGGSRIVEEKIRKRGVTKSRTWNVEYLVVCCKVIVTFIIISKMCRRKSVQ